MSIKRLLPKALKIWIKQSWRWYEDKRKGYSTKWASQPKKKRDFLFFLELKQPIFSTHLSTNKIHNIQKASQRIESFIIKPKQILSFWQCVGAPNKTNGFKKGRNLIAGKLKEDYGGGLCQISGMVYHLSLIAGLKILERHNHSVDIYKESERYTPLGSDATVVYGYKDLRILNNHPFPIYFQFEITKKGFIGKVYSEQKITKHKIIFETKTFENQKIVTTKKVLKKKNIILNKSSYSVNPRS